MFDDNAKNMLISDLFSFKDSCYNEFTEEDLGKMRRNIDCVLETLGERELHFLMLRYVSRLSYGKLKCEVKNLISGKIGISASRAQQLSRKILRRMRHPSRMKIIMRNVK